MSELIPDDNDELSYFDIFETLWVEKWKVAIITFLVLSVGIYFNLNEDDSFQITVPMNSAKPEVFVNYHYLNEFSDKNSFNIKMNSDQVFDSVVREFNDYEEIISVLQKDEIVKEQIKDLDEENKLLFLQDYAKKFELLPNLSDAQYERRWVASAMWHDAEKGKSLMKDAMLMTLVNVKKSISSQVELLSKNVGEGIELELENLNRELDSLSTIEVYNNNSRIQYLTEQAAIAKELGIEFEKDGYIGVQMQSDDLTLNLNDRPFYLNGYKAIEQEINNIESRSKEQLMLMSPKFLPLMEQIIKLKNDDTAEKLKLYAENIRNDEVIDWIEFDTSFADTKSLNRSGIYIYFSIILGFILGSIYVLIAKSYKIYRETETKYK